jgi:Leucine-rich repeat (LRR) protein
MLYCDYTNLKDISHLKSLTKLRCMGTDITDISGLSSLHTLICPDVPDGPESKLKDISNAPPSLRKVVILEDQEIIAPNHVRISRMERENYGFITKV